MNMNTKSKISAYMLRGGTAAILIAFAILTAIFSLRATNTPNLCSAGGVPGLLHRWSFDDGTANDSVGDANGTLFGGATIADGKLHVTTGQYMKTSPLGETITARTLVSWVSLDTLSQGGGSALTIEQPVDPTDQGNNVFDAIDYAERTANQWMAGSDFFNRSAEDNGGAAETVTSPGEVMIAIVYDATDGITIYRNGVLYANRYEQGTLQTYPANGSEALIGLRHSTCGSNCWLSASIDEARIYGSALTADQIAQLYQAGPGCGVQNGAFVIGDVNAVVGNHVYFWGSQWSSMNTLSQSSAPAAFKGFANSTTPALATCGGTWKSDPGNSSARPATVPASITVIATSSATKSGSVISGNNRKLVVVMTDPGYEPNSGHPGTGTVIAVSCP